MMMTRILRMMSIFDSDGPPHLRAITTYQARTGAAVVNIYIHFGRCRHIYFGRWGVVLGVLFSFGSHDIYRNTTTK
jgi:hypothetical protein